MKPSCNIATLIERFFTDRLIRQRNVSANTIASYRDTFRLLFTVAQTRLRKPPSALALDDLDAPFISAFLADLETKRGASVRTRNLRLTAIRSFFRFVSFEEPAYSAHIQRVLAIPTKRHDKRQLHFLTRAEIEAILATPDRTTWLGRRDYTLLLLAVQTGLGGARCRHGSRNRRGAARAPCSPTCTAAGSAPTASSRSWPSMCASPARDVHHWRPSGYRRTC